MAFDIATAQPIEEEDTGFDLNTAQPVDSTSRLPDDQLSEINRLNENPGNREFMYIPGQNVNVDLPKGGISSFWNMTKRAFDSGNKGTERSQLGAQVFNGDKSPEIEARISKLDKELGGPNPVIGVLPPPEEGWASYAAKAIAEEIPNIMGFMHSGLETGLVTGGTTMAAAAIPGPQQPFMAGLTALTFGAGFTAGSLEYAYTQMAGDSFLEYRNFTDDEGNKLPEDLARLGAFMTGVVGAGMEAAPMGLLFRMLPGTRTVFQKAGFKATEAIKFPKSTKIMKDFLFNMAQIAAAEGITEVAQEGTQIEIGELLKKFANTSGEFEPVSTTEILDRMKEAGIKGALVGGFLGGAATGVSTVVDAATPGTSKKVLDKGVDEDIEGQKVESQSTDISPENIAKVVENVKTVVSEVAEETQVGAPTAPTEEGDTSFSPEELEEKQITQVEESLQSIAPTKKTRDTLIRGRLEVLDKDIRNIDTQVESLNNQIDQRNNDRKPTKALETKVDKLLNDRAELDIERDNVLLLGLANNLKVSKKASPEEDKRQRAEAETELKMEEAELILEELEEGTEPERQFEKDALGVIVDVFSAESTNPAFLSGRVDLGVPDPLALNVVGLKQGGKKPNRRSKRAVINAVKRIINGKPAPDDKPQAALHQRILDLIDDRLEGVDPRFAPGTGQVDPNRGNSKQVFPGDVTGTVTIQDLFNEASEDALASLEVDTDKDIQIKGKKLVKLEEQSLRDQERALSKGLREGARLANNDIKQAIKNTKQLIRETSLPKATKDSIIAQFVTGEADFVKNIPKLKSKIGSEFERLGVKEQKNRINKSLSRKTLKPKVVSGVKQGKFDAEIQSALDNLSVLNKTSGKVNPDTGESDASILLDDRISKAIDDPLGNAIINIKANPRSVTSAELKQLADDIDILLSEGRLQAKERVLRKQINVANGANEINNFVTKGENIQAWQRSGTTGAFRTAKNWVQQTVSRLTDGWDEVIDRIVPGNKASSFEIGIEIQKEKGIKRRMANKLTKAAESSFGIKDGRKLRNLLDSSNEIVDHGLFVNTAGKEVRLEMSVSQARKLFMEWQDPTLRETLTGETGNAYSDEMLTYIFNSILGEQDKSFAEEQLQIYREFYDEINEVYKRVFGINLDRNEFYSPIRRQVDGQEIGLDEFGNDINYRSKVNTSKSLIARQKSIQPIMQRSDISVFNQHITAMSRFIALREKTQFLNSVFGKTEVRKNLEAKFGKDFNLFIGEHLESFVNGGNRASDILSKTINFFNRNFAASQLGAKAKIGFTQTVSYFAYAEFVPATDFIAGTRDFFLNMPKAIKTLSKSELLKARGFSQEVEIARLGKVFDNAFINRIQKKQDKMIDYMLIATKVGDRLPILVGGWSVYRHVLKETGSEVKAMQAFERATAKTQQSTDQDQLSLAQKTNPLMRGLTMFMSAPIAQFRGESRAVRQLLKGESSPRQFAKAILIYHFILPGLYQAISNGLIFGEWDKEDQIRAAILGSFNGIPIMGDIMNSTIRKIQGKSTRGTEILKWTKPIIEMLDDLFEAMESGKEGDFEELTESIYDAFKNSGSLTGLPTPQIDNVKKGFEDLDNGDLKASSLRFLGWPDSTIQNIE